MSVTWRWPRWFARLRLTTRRTAPSSDIVWRPWCGVEQCEADRDRWAKEVLDKAQQEGVSFVVCGDTLIVAFRNGNVFDAQLRRLSGPGPTALSLPSEPT